MTVVAERVDDRRAAPDEACEARPVLLSPTGPLAGELSRLLTPFWHVVDATDQVATALFADGAPAIDTLVYVPRPQRPPDLEPDLAAAERICDECRRADVRHLVLVSSTAAYGATPHHSGLVSESGPLHGQGQPVARSWQALETLAVSVLGAGRVTILRAAPTAAAGSADFFSRLFTSVAFPLAGYDPTLQVLTVTDFARAIDLAVTRARPGTFNIVPAAPIALRAALRIAGRATIPVPWTVQRALRRIASPSGAAASGRQVQFIRYHLTASADKAARELGFHARETSADAVRVLGRARACGTGSPAPGAAERFDAFGLDRSYIDASWRGVMGFLHRRYWRVEARGLEHVPRAGGGVLVGMHRGFMPFDGVMTLHSVVQGTGRVPRFLIHPGVGMRFPFLFDLMSKLGGVIACQVNADRVLESGELLGVYPEGIRGAFTMYRRAHRIGPSWRNDCVAFALRHRVPIIPFVTIGSAEIFPIVGRIDWAWWKKLTEWPFIPVTSPFPLPSKWHTLVLEPMHTEREYGPEAADDPAVVRRIGAELKSRMEAATADLIRQRKSIFWGSVFQGEIS